MYEIEMELLVDGSSGSKVLRRRFGRPDDAFRYACCIQGTRAGWHVVRTLDGRVVSSHLCRPLEFPEEMRERFLASGGREVS